MCTIIGLTHQGYDEDLELASKLTSIDVIIGGHSHTKPEIYPNIVKSKDGADVAVVQAFWATRYLGYLEVDVGDGCQLVSATGELIELGDNPDEPESFVEDDEEITALIETLRKPIADFSMEVVGTTNVFLNAERGAIRASETNLGSLICEAMVRNKTFFLTIVDCKSWSHVRSLPIGFALHAFTVHHSGFTTALKN